MTATGAHKFLTFIGILVTLNAAYSAIQHRSYPRWFAKEKSIDLPFDIVIQSIAGLFIVMYGVVHIAGEFKEIRAAIDLERKSWETLYNLPSFQMFNHRGRRLSREYMYSKDLEEK